MSNYVIRISPDMIECNGKIWHRTPMGKKEINEENYFCEEEAPIEEGKIVARFLVEEENTFQN